MISQMRLDRGRPEPSWRSGGRPSAAGPDEPPSGWSLPSFAVAALAVLAAWRPTETSPWTAPILVAGVLLLLPRVWSPGDGARLAVLGAVAAGLAASALSGPDAASGLRQVALVVTAIAIGWLASRSAPGDGPRLLLGAGLAALSVWAVWQLSTGFDLAADVLADLPADVRPVAQARIASGRGFASLLVPGHLALVEVLAALLLAPLLVRRSTRLAAGGALVAAAVGLVVSRSPIGIALAGAAGIALALSRRRVRASLAVALAAAIALAAVAGARPDVLELEPVRLRFDNWRTAAWAIGSSPLVGVGYGGYGLATATAPLEVGNRPAHAHCLPLELAAELGVAGWLLAIGAAAWVAGACRVGWRSFPALGLAVAVVPIHNLVDFSLFSSAVAVPWAVVVGWALSGGRVRRREGGGPSRAVAIGVAAAAVGVAALSATSVALERTAITATPENRFDLAARAAGIAPWRSGPPTLAAALALQSADRAEVEAAAGLVDRARRLRRGSSRLSGLQSRLRTVLGEPLGAVAAGWRACRLQPPVGQECDAFGRLSARLEEIGGGAVE